MSYDGPIDFSGGDSSRHTTPGTSRRDLSKLSPYLNFDPGYLPPTTPEFIFLDESARTRGRMELAFSQVSNYS